ncbi:MAG: sugar ABC transporter ATP-binding protein [Kofleriaceae bacterium]|nr:sugar ABC transporter ATP-binding protein [Kofleriaceae bacterium]
MPGRPGLGRQRNRVRGRRRRRDAPPSEAVVIGDGLPRPEERDRSASVVELRKIGKQFPGVRALHDVSLAIEPGEVLGLVGENGAGKSTLIKILGGVYAAGSFKGDVVVAGKVAAFRSTRDARTAGIAVVHQELSLVPAMSVAENLMLGREPSRLGLVDAASIEAAARALLDRVFGADARSIDVTAPVETLAVGVQQMLEIARALAEHARVIVLDEPTAALTESEAERLFALVRERRAAGTSFIYISHRLGEIQALSDRIAVMRDGELVGLLDTKATTEDEVVMLMTGDAAALDRARTRARTRPRAEGEPVLSVERLSIRRSDDRRVVDELSFDVRAGEVVALAGALGAGRTATLSALFGIARGELTGTVKVDGKPVALRSPADAIAAGFAFVPEDRKAQGLVLGLSVADNLALSALGRMSKLGIVDGARAEQAALARLRDLSIKVPGLGAEVATLSGGNQQKVVIGKWLELAPRVLLLDEPTRGVDVGAKAEIYALVEELTSRGHAVVLASSDLPEVVRLAHRVLVLREGKHVGTLEGDDITQLGIMQLAVGSAATRRAS